MLKRKPAPPSEADQLRAKIAEIEAAAEKLVADKAAEIKAVCEPVPLGVIKQQITGGSNCACAILKKLLLEVD